VETRTIVWPVVIVTVCGATLALAAVSRCRPWAIVTTSTPTLE
jgi:hypothetical protein